MIGRLCRYKKQQHFKLLSQFVFKVSAFRFNTQEDACTTYPDSLGLPRRQDT